MRSESARSPPARRAQAQPPHDVLDVDDRVVHDHPDRDHEPGQDHRVDRRAAQRTARSPAATSDSGIATRLISAARHSNRKATRTRTTSRQPRSSAVVRLWIAISMKLAGRKIVGVDRPRRAGRAAGPSSASSTPLVTSSVFAPWQLLDDEQQAGAAVDRPRRRSAAAAPSTTFATSPMRSSLAVAAARPRPARGRPACAIGVTCADAEALVRRARRTRRCRSPRRRRELQQAGVEGLAVDLHDLVERDLSSRMRRRVDLDVLLPCRRSPQIATLATPGTRSSRARIFQ